MDGTDFKGKKVPGLRNSRASLLRDIAAILKNKYCPQDFKDWAKKYKDSGESDGSGMVISVRLHRLADSIDTLTYCIDAYNFDQKQKNKRHATPIQD